MPLVFCLLGRRRGPPPPPSRRRAQRDRASHLAPARHNRPSTENRPAVAAQIEMCATAPSLPAQIGAGNPPPLPLRKIAIPLRSSLTRRLPSSPLPCSRIAQ